MKTQSLGTPVKAQCVERGNSTQYTVTIPSDLAKAYQINPGDIWYWKVKDGNGLLLRREPKSILQTITRNKKTRRRT